MIKKYLIYIVLLVLILVSVLYYFLYYEKKSPKVLGLSINNFYSNKNISVDNIPEKKSNVEDPYILSGSAILIDNKTKYPLYAKNEHESVSIASITKVMTFIVARDNYELEDIIKVKKDSTEVAGSKVGIKEGEEISVKSLLYGLLINSGNDTAYALAENYGSVDDFVKKMNETAVTLGMNDTKFLDPAGLNDGGRSSAFDVAILFSYALHDELFKEIVGTAETEISSSDGNTKHMLNNSNRLVTGEVPFDGIIGGKTGFTLDAGHTLVCAAERNGNTIISVILKTSVNSKSASAIESKKLLSWGFDSFVF